MQLLQGVLVDTLMVPDWAQNRCLARLGADIAAWLYNESCAVPVPSRRVTVRAAGTAAGNVGLDCGLAEPLTCCPSPSPSGCAAWRKLGVS